MDAPKALTAVIVLLPVISYAWACDIRNVKGDIVFLLDSSSSINDTDFELALNFVKDFADSVTVSGNDVRIAVILFAFTVNIAFDLDTYNSSDEVRAAIHAIHRTYGRTAMYEALRTVHETLFGPSNRREVQHSVILITDGKSSNPHMTRVTAQSLKADGVMIITIGVGRDVDWTELNDIASSGLHAIFLEKFKLLPKVLDGINHIICSDCNITDVKADIVFLLDSSSSISDTNFKIILGFVKNLTDSFTIAPDFVRTAIFKYAFKAYMEFDLNMYNTSNDIYQAIDNIQRTYGRTATHYGLERVHSKSGLVYGNTRPNVKHFLILITDGFSSNKAATEHEAKLLQEDGVEIIAIGITSGINKDELLHVASSPDHFLNINNFEMLPSLYSKVFNLLCKVYNPSITTTTSAHTTSDSIILGPPGIVG